jgi:hypothetical protein
MSLLRARFLLGAFGLPALLACGNSSSATSGDATAPPGSEGGADSPPTDASADSPAAHPDAADGGSCLTGTVNFELHLAPGATGTTYCLGGPGSCTDGDWLSILTADGGNGLSQVRGCVPDCSNCQPAACANLCAAPTALGDGGVTRAWNGAYWQHSTCGASSLSCTNDECAPAGNYIAHLCGYPQPTDAGALVGPCLPSSTPTCVDVPFVWPPPSGAATVSGELGGSIADAGAGD